MLPFPNQPVATGGEIETYIRHCVSHAQPWDKTKQNVDCCEKPPKLSCTAPVYKVTEWERPNSTETMQSADVLHGRRNQKDQSCSSSALASAKRSAEVPTVSGQLLLTTDIAEWSRAKWSRAEHYTTHMWVPGGKVRSGALEPLPLSPPLSQQTREFGCGLPRYAGRWLSPCDGTQSRPQRVPAPRCTSVRHAASAPVGAALVAQAAPCARVILLSCCPTGSLSTFPPPCGLHRGQFPYTHLTDPNEFFQCHCLLYEMKLLLPALDCFHGTHFFECVRMKTKVK